ncbi:hypothetical protein JOQ06_016588 [Pogonophryne albipinna]|uniref:Uncharacterized protein n=1 Tax=Pogonophryne albipinna TaxID=1090488 RepID=A0AAD6F663_9TELE|nr:hypothetical protein JOQ06_016588 [Pogonophryne albipinna]
MEVQLTAGGVNLLMDCEEEEQEYMCIEVCVCVCVQCPGAPLGFRLNGRLVRPLPGGGASELQLRSHPRGSASGFSSVQIHRPADPPIITSQLGPVPPPDCRVCMSQYKLITELRGFMCCKVSPLLTPPHRACGDFLFDGPPSPPSSCTPPPAPPPSDPPQGKLVIMVEDFYYGSTPGRRKEETEDRKFTGPLRCIHCPETLSNNTHSASIVGGVPVDSQDALAYLRM